jgi:hypothetical protein
MQPSVAEIFGHGVGNSSPQAVNARAEKCCPFRQSACTKGSADDPLGICSFAAPSANATVVCPVRFLERGRIFRDVGAIAFGKGSRVAVTPEIRVLKLPGQAGKRIGKIDFMLARLGPDDQPQDFCALEVQAVYFSGKSIRPAFNHFLATGELKHAARRPDFRSSAQKRLMPQLSLKVPIFRRWGKKFFVVVDDSFFSSLPGLKTVSSAANAELTWMVYPFQPQPDSDYQMGDPRIVHTLWDDVVSALREGEAPEPGEILSEIRSSLPRSLVLNV